MIEELEIYPYKLFSRSRLNSQSVRKRHEGALIRFKDQPGAGCIHPWPDLGDLPLDQQLQRLRSGESTPLIEGALNCARSNWDTWFTGNLKVPGSHFTAPDPLEDDPARLYKSGFRVVKLKAHGKDLEDFLPLLWRWSDAGFQVRMDFNESATAAEILEFWESLPDPSVIDFLEDPVPWDDANWSLLKSHEIPLAADRDLHPDRSAKVADWWVIKPALVNASELVARADKMGKKVIFTSYMDHAVGQLWAMAEAARCGVSHSCGLLTHHLYEEDPFFNLIQTAGPDVTNAKELPQEYQRLLDGMPWKNLVGFTTIRG